MPRFNETGPMGMGPMTGRCCGPCCFRGRKGAGRGLGRYCGWGFPQTKKDQLKALAEYKKALEEEIEEVKKEEGELGKEK